VEPLSVPGAPVLVLVLVVVVVVELGFSTSIWATQSVDWLRVAGHPGKPDAPWLFLPADAAPPTRTSGNGGGATKEALVVLIVALLFPEPDGRRCHISTTSLSPVDHVPGSHVKVNVFVPVSVQVVLLPEVDCATPAEFWRTSLK